MLGTGIPSPRSKPMAGLATARKRTAGRRARARRLTAAERKEQLLDVASEILVGDGVRALTMERLAERSSVSKGLGYAYFRDVEDVVLALWDREIGRLYSRIQEATEGARSLEELVGLAVNAYLDLLGERGALLGSLQAQLNHRQLEERIEKRVRAFVLFWQEHLAAFLPLERRTAVAVAAMAPAAVDACARVWQLGAISRADAERMARAFVLGGAREAAAADPVALPARRAGKPR